MQVTWAADGAPPFNTFNVGAVQKTGGTLRFPVAIHHELEWIGALYSEQMVPVAAWTGPLDCNVEFIQPTSAGLCAAASDSTQKKTAVALLTEADGYKTPVQVHTLSEIVGTGCTDALFTGYDLGNDVVLVDLSNGSLHEPSWPEGGAADTPRLRGDYALLMRAFTRPADGMAGSMGFDGWLWRPPGVLTRLVDAGAEDVSDISSDGTRLVWVQGPEADIITGLAPGDLWVSPFDGTNPPSSPKKLRAVPEGVSGLPRRAVGGGYYAYLAGQPNLGGMTQVHVYRLSDGRHWAAPILDDLNPDAPPDRRTIPIRIMHVDSEEVWWLGANKFMVSVTIVRQRLDALGAGD
jgi:hypothetical protein